MKKISLLTCSAALLWPLSLSAQICTTPPSCDTLGYKQAAADCTGQQMLKCPFDNTKVFCGGTACSEDYTLTSCDTGIGYCAVCGGKYKYTSCKTGWYLDGIQCRANPCNGYPLYSSCDASRGTCGTTTCLSGSKTKYKYTSCNTSQGWKFENGNCVADWSACPAFIEENRSCAHTYYTESSHQQNLGPLADCIAGGIKYVYHTACTNGKELSDGLCEEYFSCIPEY